MFCERTLSHQVENPVSDVSTPRSIPTAYKGVFTVFRRWDVLVLKVGGFRPLSKPLALADFVLPFALVLLVQFCHALQLLIGLQITNQNLESLRGGKEGTDRPISGGGRSRS
jgi:hypothetical protein